MKIRRVLNLEKLVLSSKSCLVLGPRGAGKTFYIKEFLSTIRTSIYINLLNSLELKKYLSAPSLIVLEIEEFLKKNSSVVVCVDEIQKIPELFDECQRAMNDFEEKITFILTGSSARKLKKNRANLLAGRALLVPFFNLSFLEVNFLENESSILQYGLLPMTFLEKDFEIKCAYLKSYVATYLKEEIIDEALTRRVDIFNQFLELAAQYNGQPLTYAKLAKQLGADERTLKIHYEILEDTMIIHTIPAWTQSIKRRLLTASKHYFFDNGILNSLRGELKTELKEGSFRFGALFENLIINEVIKIMKRGGEEFKLFHYRTDRGEEIDLIIQKITSLLRLLLK